MPTQTINGCGCVWIEPCLLFIQTTHKLPSLSSAGLEPAYTSVISALNSWWEYRRERRKQQKRAWVFSSVDVSGYETVAVNVVYLVAVRCKKRWRGSGDIPAPGKPWEQCNVTVGLIGTGSARLRTAYEGQNHSVRFTHTVVLIFTVTAMRTPNVTRTERTG